MQRWIIKPIFVVWNKSPINNMTVLLETLIEQHLNHSIISKNSIGTGIFEAYKITLSNGQTYFVKYQSTSSQQLINEANMLRTLGGTIYTPKVLASCKHCLILEWIEERFKQSNQAQLGRDLASLHRITQDYYGFNVDNHIGTTPQLNASDKHINNWIDFFWNYRLLFQINLANTNGHLNRVDYQSLMAVKDTLPSLIDIDITPALLHGDLWSGNVMSTDSGPCFIDPACYFGHREIDFSLTFMFGGFTEEFYSTYEQEFPFDQGFEQRKPLYMLYHYLNHLNIFGSGYHANVMNCVSQLKAS